jgi:hypothetical protein
MAKTKSTTQGATGAMNPGNVEEWDEEWDARWDVGDAVFALLDERYCESGSLDYEIVIRGPGFEVVRARSIYWSALAKIAQNEAADREDYAIEIVELVED